MLLKLYLFIILQKITVHTILQKYFMEKLTLRFQKKELRQIEFYTELRA